MRLPILALLATACGGIVEPNPTADAGAAAAPLTTAAALAAWSDPLCGARAIAVATAHAERLETREREDYPGAPWLVRTFDGARPAAAGRACFRDKSPTACSCRDLAPGEAAYAEQLDRREERP